MKKITERTKVTLTIGQLQKLVNETVFDQKELRALANESQWMSIEEYVKKNDLDLDEFLGCASTNGEPMPPNAKLPIDELDYYASNCEKSSKGYKQSKIFVFGIQWDTHDETTNPLPSRAKLTVPTPNGKADKRGIHDYLYSIYKVEPLDFDWEDLTNDLPHGMFAPSWGEQVNEAKKVKQPRYTIAQYCDMKGLDADKLMAAMKAHWSILSPPLTDRTMFLASALDTYAERYADEMNADTPLEVQADDEAGDEEEVEVDKPYRDCGVTVHTTQGDREYGMKDYSETKWFDSKDDLKHWIECGIDGTDGSEQDRFYGMLDQLDSGIKVVDYNEVNEGKLHKPMKESMYDFKSYRPGYRRPAAIGRKVDWDVIKKICSLLNDGHNVTVEFAERGGAGTFYDTMCPATPNSRGQMGIRADQSYAYTSASHNFIYRDKQDSVCRIKYSQIVKILKVDGEPYDPATYGTLLGFLSKKVKEKAKDDIANYGEDEVDLSNVDFDDDVTDDELEEMGWDPNTVEEAVRISCERNAIDYFLDVVSNICEAKYGDKSDVATDNTSTVFAVTFKGKE